MHQSLTLYNILCVGISWQNSKLDFVHVEVREKQHSNDVLVVVIIKDSYSFLSQGNP